jgi:O-antigen ligase
VINKYKLNVFLSTLNFILCFIGFQLVTSIFLPHYSNFDGIVTVQSVTIPYRAFSLGLSLLVIIINITKIPRFWPLSLKLFLFFWVILIIRFLYDDVIRTDISLGDTSQIWLYMLGICVPAFLSIIVSYKYIDINKSFLFILISIGISLTIFLASGLDGQGGRQGGNIAVSTITFGHFGVTAVILGIYSFLFKKINFIFKIFLIYLIFIGVFVMLIAGSRGPILALIVVLMFWIFSYIKRPSYAVVSIILASILSLIFMDYILELMGEVSPIIESRLRSSIYDGDTSNRTVIYKLALDMFFDSPILGKQLFIIYTDDKIEYAHNLILDALMGLGIVGGISISYFLIQAFKKSYRLIHIRDPNFWIVLLLIQQIVMNMLSGAFYYNQLLSVLLAFIFLKYRRI